MVNMVSGLRLMSNGLLPQTAAGLESNRHATAWARFLAFLTTGGVGRLPL
jgi:hypothetical protein